MKLHSKKYFLNIKDFFFSKEKTPPVTPASKNPQRSGSELVGFKVSNNLCYVEQLSATIELYILCLKIKLQSYWTFYNMFIYLLKKKNTHTHLH